MSLNGNSQLDKLDEQSQIFIKWNFKQLEDDESLIQVIEESTSLAEKWLIDHLDELRGKLKSKMIKGALEHGAPIHPLEKLERELEGEYLDLIGWSQILKYNRQKLKRK